MQQTTIRKSVYCGGIGLHSGKKVELTLRPAPENTGILFALQNGNGSSFLTPDPTLVTGTGLATTLGTGRETVSTVEHLLSALRGLGIDNVRVEVSGGELPIMDGSAAPFVYLIKQAGIRSQAASRRVLAVKRNVVFEQDGKYIKASPYRGFHLDYTIDFKHPLIGRQRVAMDVTPSTYTELARARTFGFLKEVEYLQANGLALGGTLENAVVLDDYRVVNDDGLRFEDEFVRHKALDFVGDMALIGLPLWGRFEVFASGHKLNNDFLRYIHAEADTCLEEISLAPERAEEVSREQSGSVAEPVPAVA